MDNGCTSVLLEYIQYLEGVVFESREHKVGISLNFVFVYLHNEIHIKQLDIKLF